MEEPPVQVFWPPTPPAHSVTSVAVDGSAGLIYTGSCDGSIVRWQLRSDEPPRASVMLVGHTCAIRHLVPGLTDPDTHLLTHTPGNTGSTGHHAGEAAARYLLSVDEAGVCCIWREPCGRCELRRRVPELAAAAAAAGAVAFAQMPQDEPLTAGWLLAALPASAVCGSPPPPPPPPSHRPPSGQQELLGKPIHNIRSGSAGGAASPAPSASSRPHHLTGLPVPHVVLVLDWRCLVVTQVLPLQPLQQLLQVELPAAAPERLELSQGRRDRSPSDPLGRFGDDALASATATAEKLLSFRVSCCRVAAPPPHNGNGNGWCNGNSMSGCHGGSTDTGGLLHGGGCSPQTVLAVAAAVDALGTLYGCILPFDPYNPPAWSLAGLAGAAAGPGAGAGAGIPAGRRGHLGQQQQQQHMGAAGPTLQPWTLPGPAPGGQQQQQQQEEEVLSVHGRLLAATLSSDLGWAVLGSADAWVVLRARRDVLPTPPPPGMGVGCGSSPANLVAPCSPPTTHLLRMCYTATGVISLMNQQPAYTPTQPGLVCPPAPAHLLPVGVMHHGASTTQQQRCNAVRAAPHMLLLDDPWVVNPDVDGLRVLQDPHHHHLDSQLAGLQHHQQHHQPAKQQDLHEPLQQQLAAHPQPATQPNGQLPLPLLRILC
ncbi:hypothetical protein Agub_g15832, partial [Astrephomene gubernaculifera]